MVKRGRSPSQSQPRDGAIVDGGSESELSLAEWAVLAAIGEGRTHGFEVARGFAPNGAFGRVWTVRRPLVYRAIRLLVDQGLIRELSETPSADGPPRRPLELTAKGSKALATWLTEPIAHVRDARSELLLKLLFNERRSLNSADLLNKQREVLEPIVSGLRTQLGTGSGFDETLTRWRLYSAEALYRFVEELSSCSTRASEE